MPSVRCEDCGKPRTVSWPKYESHTPIVCHPCRRIRREHVGRKKGERAESKKGPLKWPVVTCADGCGASRRSSPSLRPQGQYRCVDCRRKNPVVPSKTKEYGRQKAAESRARKRATTPPRQAICVQCDRRFTPAAARQTACSPECAKARVRIKRERYEAKHPERGHKGTGRPGPKPRTCINCGSAFTRSKHSERKYCGECVDAKVWEARTSQQYTPCIKCGKEKYIQRPAKSGFYLCHPCRRTDPAHRASMELAKQLRDKKTGTGGDYRKRAKYFGVEYEPVDKRKVFARDKWMCGICGGQVDKTLKYPDPLSVSLDHIVPMSKGGPHSYANTQCSHLKCNVEKGNRGGVPQQLALIG